MRSFVPLALATSLLAACASPPPFEAEAPPPPAAAPAPIAAPSFEAASLAGSVWDAVEVDGIPAKPELQQTLQFASSSEVAGFGGCNSFTGTATMSGAELRFGPLAATRKACAGEAMAREAMYFSTLGAVRSAKVENDRLLLQDESGKKVLVFARSQ
jgi:heat shock protein HslJ